MLARLAAAGITFSIPLVLARTMALAEYGTYKQLFLIAQTLALVLPFGMAQSLYFFIPRAESRRPWFGQTLGFLLAAGLLGGTSLLLLAPWIAQRLGNPDLVHYRWELAVYVAGTVAATPLELSFTSQGRTRLSARA
jgi:hypothetical protein